MVELIDSEIKQATLIRAPAATVYDALTTGAGLDSWFTSGSEVDRQSGGKIVFRWKNWGPDNYTLDATGTVLEVDRPKRFVFQWYPEDKSYATTIEVTFEAVEEGTVVRLREYGYHNTPAGIAATLECAAGWGEAITLLKYYVEHGHTY